MEGNESSSITLSPETSQRLREKMAMKGYRDPEQLIDDALDAFEPSDPELERWMLEEVVAACEELDRDPTQVMTLEESARDLQKEYARFQKAG